MTPEQTSDILTVCVVSHTHWDREWYHDAARFRQRLVALVENSFRQSDGDLRALIERGADVKGSAGAGALNFGSLGNGSGALGAVNDSTSMLGKRSVADESSA